MIEVDGVSRSFDGLAVLEDVSLTVPEGRFVGLVGPNGAGKTTLLRTMSGALEPDEGRVSIDGTDVHALSSNASSRLMSVVPQTTTLSFAFDVRDVVEMGRTPHRGRFEGPTRADRKAVDRALERTRTRKFADRSIDEVSGGERQRVLLARAIAQETPVVLLDEPTASLDVAHQVETLELVDDLVADGRTVVAAIHDLDLAARYCDELAVLADGSILESGPPRRVLRGDLLERAFDATAVVTTNPATGSPSVTALASDDEVAADDADRPVRVHVVGSGRTAAAVLARLAGAGLSVSIGPLARDAVAAESARVRGLDRIAVEPHAPVSPAALDDLRAAIDRAAVTVVADLEVTPGNRHVLDPLDDADPAIVVETRPLPERTAAVDERARTRYEAFRDRADRVAPEAVLEAVRGASRSALDEAARSRAETDDD